MLGAGFCGIVHTTQQHPPHSKRCGLVPNPAESVTPIFVSVKQAADMLAISPWSMYQLLDDGAVKSQYKGRRRLVSVASLREYAESLPTEPLGA